jgi:hypothetical protein
VQRSCGGDKLDTAEEQKEKSRWNAVSESNRDRRNTFKE